MKIQLDTNIVLDILEERQPFSVTAGQLLDKGLRQTHSMFITGNSVDNIAYVLRKKLSPKQIMDALSQFFKIVSISPVNEKIIHNAINARWKDFEDAIQYFSALEAGADVIVTRDVKGYQEKTVKVVEPREALGLLNG